MIRFEIYDIMLIFFCIFLKHGSRLNNNYFNYILTILNDYCEIKLYIIFEIE